MLIGKSISVKEFIEAVDQKIIDQKMENNHLRDLLNKANQKMSLLNAQQQGNTAEKTDVANEIRKLKQQITELDHETEFLIERKESAEKSNPDQMLHLGLRDLEQFGVYA